jgi:hypothetical protein
VVVVVPRLAEGGQCQPEDIGGLVVRAEPPLAEEVADRVDREGHVVDQEDPHEAGPEERGQAADQLAVDAPAGQEGDRQSGDHKGAEHAVHHSHAAVLEQVRRVLVRVLRGRVVEEPAEVRVPEAAQRPAEAVAVAVRAVRVAVVVRVRVVAAVVRDPADNRSLDRHRAKGGEQVLDRLVGLEGAVGEQPVVADRDAHRAHEVHAAEQQEVAPADQLVPQHRDRGQHGDERQHHGDDVHGAVQASHDAH